MKQAVFALLIGILLLAAGCSGGAKEEGPVAQKYVEPPEVTALDDSVQIYGANPEANFDGYRAIYEHFIKQYPNSTVLQREMQDLYDGFGMTEEKVKLYDSLYDAHSGIAMYAYLDGRANSGQRSRDLIREAVRIDSTYFWGHYGLAYMLLSDTPPDTAGAIEEYKKCVEIDNSNPGPYRQLAHLYTGAGDYKDALAAVSALAITMPGDFLSVGMKADIYKKMGDDKSAEKVLVDFADKNPEHQQVRRELINMYENAGRWADVLVLRHQMVKLANDPAKETFELAEAYINLNQPDSALSYVDAAAIAGYSDYRRLEKNPAYEPVRGLEGYPDVLVKVKANAEKEREDRLSDFLKNEKENKAEVLKDKLNIEAPLFALPNLEGKTVSLADQKGKVVVLDFWATWCGPCRLTMPLLQDYIETRPAGVEFYSVNVWESDTSLVRPFLADFGYDFNVLFADNSVPNEYGVNGIPTLFVIDKDGIIRYKHVGYSPYADQILTWQVNSLL